ncbi:PmoA family protein [Paraflavisolibacter sp. H34]|uniref:DUF6807 domain-containing protein n=1 Tax=Huijunlia imazamoxiresistens TaxID=3127457 RepID=UPI00301B37D1
MAFWKEQRRVTSRLVMALWAIVCSFSAGAQKMEKGFVLRKEKGENKVAITLDGKPFTAFLYPDSLEKPVLYPLHAAGGQSVTRGFPLQPEPGDPVDHPHHIGLWFNYENVNGLDFWNNSFAIPAERKPRYGWVKTDSILQLKSGATGTLAYSARWEDIHQNLLLKERTTYRFQAAGNRRIIDRVTTLTAAQDVVFNDVKDGLIALRIARRLQLPAHKKDSLSTGNYLSSRGIEGDSVWSTRASWCLLYGKLEADSISIAIIDHPSNPGYPTYWHARGYGLFAANPLGQKVFSKGADSLQLGLPKGKSVTFRYRVVLDSGKERMRTPAVEKLAKEFARKPE